MYLSAGCVFWGHEASSVRTALLVGHEVLLRIPVFTFQDPDRRKQTEQHTLTHSSVHKCAALSFELGLIETKPPTGVAQNRETLCGPATDRANACRRRLATVELAARPGNQKGEVSPGSGSRQLVRPGAYLGCSKLSSCRSWKGRRRGRRTAAVPAWLMGNPFGRPSDVHVTSNGQ